MYRFRRPDRAWLRATLDRVSQAELTYPRTAVGATEGPRLTPPGFRAAHFQAELGRGAEVFARAADGVRSWEMFRGAGLDVVPSAPTADPGATVVTVLHAGPVHVVSPCRVVDTVDRPDAAGFAYGTLPGHPVEGEERFVVEHRADDRVWFVVDAFSRPADLLSRCGAPVTQLTQNLVSRRYLKALQSFVLA